MSKKRLTGKVISNKMSRTVVVAVDTFRPHPRYEKVVRRTKKYAAAADTPLPVGTAVVIEQTRPLSRTKRWRVLRSGAGEKEAGK